MEIELLKINILSIAGIGLLMLLTGLLLYLFKANIVQHLRFFLPIPPLGVAAYVFVFNFFKNSDGDVPDNIWATMREVLLGTAIAALVFCVFSLFLIISINYLKRYL